MYRYVAGHWTRFESIDSGNEKNYVIHMDMYVYIYLPTYFRLYYSSIDGISYLLVGIKLAPIALEALHAV